MPMYYLATYILLLLATRPGGHIHNQVYTTTNGAIYKWGMHVQQCMTSTVCVDEKDAHSYSKHK